MKILTKNGKPILVHGKMITVDEVVQIKDITANGSSIAADGVVDLTDLHSKIDAKLSKEEASYEYATKDFLLTQLRDYKPMDFNLIYGEEPLMDFQDIIQFAGVGASVNVVYNQSEFATMSRLDLETYQLVWVSDKHLFKLSVTGEWSMEDTVTKADLLQLDERVTTIEQTGGSGDFSEFFEVGGSTVKSKNLADPSEFTQGYFYQANGNQNNDGSIYFSTGLIPVEVGQTFSCTDARMTVFYKADGTLTYTGLNFSSNYAGKNTTFSIPANIGLMRVTGYRVNADRWMLNEGDTLLPYEPYGDIETEGSGYRLKADVGIPSNPLYGKKWAVCGDSFTYGAESTTISGGRYDGKKKVYPYFIGARNNMEILDTFFRGGRTLAYPSDGSFTNALTCPSADWYFQKIPQDVDYITIYLGINDSHHRSSTSSGDGEDNTGVIPIGTINDTTTSTYYGAFNVVLSWLMENRPFAHIGIIVSNGVDTADYRTAQIDIAKKYGIPYIDLNGDERTPVMIRSVNPNIASAVKTIVNKKQAVDYVGGNLHPNDDAHLYESYFIEDFLRSI